MNRDTIPGEIAASAAAAVKTAPPVAVTGLSLLGMQMSDWVYVVTLVWLLIQIGSWAYDRFIKPRRRGRGQNGQP